MLLNIAERETLTTLARLRARRYETKTVNKKLRDEYTTAGWIVERENLASASVRVRRAKPDPVWFEDRVWTLLYRLGFQHLSKEGGAQLVIDPKGEATTKTQIDVVGVDEDVALAIECKTAISPTKKPQFQEDLAKHSQIREKFTISLKSALPSTIKRQPILAMFLQNIELSERNWVRAREARMLIFDDADLTYYESLEKHLGQAAKYQFLAECMPGRSIPGLEITVPAVRARMGGHNCYTFSISPEYLLKIAFVSHRAKGKASDVHTYQRMLSKGRLNRIREYIEDDGIFPTNIVINLEKGRATWDRSVQEENSTDLDVGILGWLHIRPAYKSAWIIDGQHRLYAYSGLEQARRAKVAVLAFEGLPESQQAQLFIDINAKQKRVPQSLLQELFADLRWEADKIEERISAVISRAIQELDNDKDSPFHHRILASDDPKSFTRCISINSIFSSLEPLKEGFYIVTKKHDEVLEYGPLWAGNNENSTHRTTQVLKNWFLMLSGPTFKWWEKGKGEGGGLAMNDPVIAFIRVLRSVFSFLQKGKLRLVSVSDNELVDLVKPYGIALGKYLGSMSEEDRRSFRDKRGIQGQTWRRRQCEKALRESFPAFNPEGLEEYLENEKAQTTQRAKEAIDQVERMLQRAIIDELKREYGPAEHEWWALGVPQKVRVKVSERQEQDDHKRGGREFYFDLIDYKYIAADDWSLFEKMLGFGKGSKDKRLAWLDYVNEKRKAVMHASAGIVLPAADLARLQEYEQWLKGQLVSPHELGSEPESEQEAAKEM